MEDILLTYLAPILITVAIGVGGFLANSFRKHLGVVAEIQKTQWRIAKAIILMAKMIDDQVEREHPKTNSELEDIVRELLKSNGHA